MIPPRPAPNSAAVSLPAASITAPASSIRLIVFDMRGVGLSDRGTEPPFLELISTSRFDQMPFV